MALPKEPRQKMINIMYLVLTALLALNVSAEILNAFKTVDNSLRATNETINASTGTIMKSFEDKRNEPESREKVAFWEPKAKQAQQLTANLDKYIEGLRSEILEKAGFKPSKENEFDSSYKEDNQDIATLMFVEGGKGKELYSKLLQYKNDMAKVEPSLAKDINNYLSQINLNMPPTKNKANNTWEAAYFRMVPTVAAVTMLRKFQNDIKTVENRVIARFHEEVGAVKVRFNQFVPIVGQNSNYLMPGQELEISAGIGAFSTEIPPQISIGGQNLPVKDGIATYSTKAQGIGEKTVTVNIAYKDQDGNPKNVTKTITYTVGQSSAAIALPEMNVLYIGYPNKVTVSGGGVGAEKISINVSGGGASVRKTANGEFVVNVSSQTDNCIISAYGDGKQIGALTYRTRLMPGATATVGGKKSGESVNAATIAAQPGVGAAIENFPLPLKYEVVRFQVVGTNADGDLIRENCSGNAFSSRAKQIIRDSKSGDILTIEEIYCKSPDGSVKKLPSLLYNIN